jgi:hypothetical protein
LINSRNLEDSHPYILDATDDERNTPVRWVDTGQSMVQPVGESSALLFLADNRWTNQHLFDFLLVSGKPVESLDHFSVYEIGFENWPAETSGTLHYLSGDQSPASDLSLPVISMPVSFEDRIEMTGIYGLESDLLPGNPLTFFSRWDVLQDGDPAPMAFFVHLVDESGELIAQQDGLGFPPHSWKQGDSFIQVHSLDLPPSPPSGLYHLQLGMYDRSSGQRWQITVDGAPVGDRLLLPEVSIR